MSKISKIRSNKDKKPSKAVQTKSLPDKTSEEVLTKRLPDRTCKAVLTKRLLTEPRSITFNMIVYYYEK